MTLEEFIINLALSSVTAALISGILAHIFQTRYFRTQAEAGYVQAKLRLYSLILFHIEKMRLRGTARGYGEEKFVFREGEIDDVIRDLNESIKERIDLLNPEALKNWLELQAVVYQKEALPRIRTFRELVLQEYNEDIIPKYRKIVGKEPRKLEYLESSR